MNRPWIGFGLIGVLVALLGVRYFFGSNPHGDAQSARSIATRGLVEAVAARMPGRKLLVLSNPYVKRPDTARRIVEMEEAGLRGLRAAAGTSGLTIGAVVYPEIRAEARDNPRAVSIDAETTTPISYLVTPDAFDLAAQAHPDCEVLVSLIGLPAELDQCEVWKKQGAPGFALLLPDLRMVGGAPAVAAAVKSGKLVAIVLPKPNAPSDDAPVGKDFQAEFDRRYLLVTVENIEAVARDTPELLQRP